jgi:hypothetical protein
MYIYTGLDDPNGNLLNEDVLPSDIGSGGPVIGTHSPKSFV